jgi:cell wall assembly regulator SMI1
MSTKATLERIIGFADKDLGQGATDGDIANAESSIGVTFPESYRRFLSEIGWGRFSHQELYGLGSDVPAHLELVRNTLVERLEMHPALPAHLIPLMNDGAGNHYCLDASATCKGECPVVFWDHEQQDDQIPERVAMSFDTWLTGLLDGLASR